MVCVAVLLLRGDGDGKVPFPDGANVAVGADDEEGDVFWFVLFLFLLLWLLGRWGGAGRWGARGGCQKIGAEVLVGAGAALGVEVRDVVEVDGPGGAGEERGQVGEFKVGLGG